MSYSTAAQRYLIKVIGMQFSLSAYQAEEFLGGESTYSTIMDFLNGDERVPKLLFYYQPRDAVTDDGELLEAAGAPPPWLSHAPSAAANSFTTPCADRRLSTAATLRDNRRYRSPEGPRRLFRAEYQAGECLQGRVGECAHASPPLHKAAGCLHVLAGRSGQ